MLAEGDGVGNPSTNPDPCWTFCGFFEKDWTGYLKDVNDLIKTLKSVEASL